eukprot:102330-Pyramimonas_sp.AAC.1
MAFRMVAAWLLHGNGVLSGRGVSPLRVPIADPSLLPNNKLGKPSKVNPSSSTNDTNGDGGGGTSSGSSSSSSSS